MYKSLLKPIMFRIDPEKAHKLTVDMFSAGLSMPILNSALRKQFAGSPHAKNEKELWGLKFPNPVGLAAGFDKDGKYYRQMAALGFGFIEIGTVTPLPQIGNPKPRLFRLPEDRALINRMGFNNDGMVAMRKRLEKREDGDYILAANIGKNKDTANEDAVKDYLLCFNELHDYVDFFVLNVSSPNTPGLRELQKDEALHRILSEIQEENRKISHAKPILLKIAPDMDEKQLDIVIKNVIENEIDGVIATNTTVGRDNLKTSAERIADIGNGGLSGYPLREQSRAFLNYLKKNLEKPVISVGGIDSVEEAVRRIEDGADLIQVYSGLIYEGPAFVKRILAAISSED